MWRADAVITVQGVSGSSHKLHLKNCLLLDTCRHNLISVGRLALTQDVGCWVTPTNGLSYLVLTRDQHTRVPLMNVGVLILSDAACASAFPFVTPTVTQGNHNTTKITGALLHRRFLHRASHSLKLLPNSTSDAPPAWAKLIEDAACDDCLRANADRMASYNHSPATTSPGELVSWDMYKVSVPHAYGGQQIVLSFHDHFSGVNKPYLLRSESETPLILERYIG